jgi:hypothetical protein
MDDQTVRQYGNVQLAWTTTTTWDIIFPSPLTVKYVIK